MTEGMIAGYIAVAVALMVGGFILADTSHSSRDAWFCLLPGIVWSLPGMVKLWIAMVLS